MSEGIPAKPKQFATELSRPFWEAASQGRFVLQSCAACGRIRHYPRLLCDACYSDTVEWKSASGRGKVHSWMVAHYAYHPAFAPELPYTLVTVDLDEGVRALGRWRSNETPFIGQPVQGVFEPREHGVDLVFSAHDA